MGHTTDFRPDWIFKGIKNHVEYAPKVHFMERQNKFKGIVSRDFGGLQMILMDRIGVPDVPLEVYSFLNFRFHIVI